MEKKSNCGVVVGILIGIVIMLLVVGGLFLTNTISFNNKSDTKNSGSSNDVINEKNESDLNSLEVNEVTFNNEKISISDMDQEVIHVSSAGVESINPNYDYYIDLKMSGKVEIRTIGMSQQNSNEYSVEFISNVVNAVDIIDFPVPAEPNEQIIYILQSNGDVYYYKVGDSRNKKYIATKVDNVSNVKKLFIYHYPAQKNAGGSWSIVAVKDNNETVALNTESV